MRYISIQQIEKPVSVIGLGTMIFAPHKNALSFSILDAFVESGGTLIDTAEIYGDPEDYGLSETTIGQWLQKRGCREKIVLMSKGCIPDTCVPLHGKGLAVAPEWIHKAIAGSLKRLGTSYLDIWLLHRDDPTVPVGEIVEALNRELEAGTIRAYGASNWTVERIEEANAYAQSHHLVGICASSPLFCLATAKEPFFPTTTYIDEHTWRWHAQTGFPVLAWSALGRGFIKYGDPNDTSRPDLVRTFYNSENFEKLNRAKELARKRNATAAAIALAYVTSQPFPCAALTGAGTPEHARLNAQTGDLILTEEELRFLQLR